MAWPTDRRPSDILTGEGVPQMWSAKMMHHTETSLVAQQVVNASWKEDLKMGDKVWIPIDKELTGAAVDVTTTGVITNLNTTALDTATSITVDVWWEVPVSVDDSSRAQTQIPALLEKLAKNAGYAWKKKLDGDTFALLSSLTSTWAGTDGQNFTDGLLLALMEGLDEANIPAERALVTDPSGIADMRKIDKFMTFDYSASPLRLAGYRGRVDAYDLPVYMTNNLTAATTGNYGALLHKDAIGLAVQSPLALETWREPTRHSDFINTSGWYGVDVLRSTFGAYFYTRKS
jgi:hypothetical protein